MRRALFAAVAAWSTLSLLACPTRSPLPSSGSASGAGATLALDGNDDGLRLVVDTALHGRVTERVAARTHQLSRRTPILRLLRDGRALPLGLDATKTATGAIGDESPFGAGRRFELSATSAAAPLRAQLTVDFHRAFPRVALLQLRIANTGKAALRLDRVELARVDMPADGAPWVFQGAAIAWAKDYIFPLRPGHRSANYMGATHEQSGGGTPLNYVWRRGGGLALAHIETRARALHLPLSRQGARARTHIEQRGVVIAPGATWRSVRAALIAGSGDYYQPVATYRALLARQGLAMPTYPKSAYDAIWCSWGYEFDVTKAELTGIVPKLAALGFGWSVIDDRWFVGYGDWRPRPQTFGKDPVAGIKSVVAATHRAGLRAKLWWMPLLVERSGGKFESHRFKTPPVLAAHPDWVILDRHGRREQGVRKLDILCPALPAVQEHTRQMVRRFIGDWGFDGHKLDVIYAVPPCYNKAHGHADPAESSRAMADIYRVIYEETKRLKPEAVTEICPCGTTPHFIWLPYMNQAVTADPRGARQVRHRIKLLKALMGARGAVYSDHIELTRIRDDHQIGADFAAAIGTGGVVGSKLIWPRPKRKLSATDDLLLTPARERVFARWLAIYRRQALASGAVRGDLYDVAHDRPETHAVQKDGVMHYAFYSAKEDGQYAGAVQLRGLAAGRFRLHDYVAGKDVATVHSDGKTPLTIQVRFKNALLIEALPLSR